MSSATRIPVFMTVTQFLDWCPEEGPTWQLVDGAPAAMAPASSTHGLIQNEIGRLLGNHLIGENSPCRSAIAPGIVPHIQSPHNLRVPDLAVTCSPQDEDGRTLTDPVLIVEILSPSNPGETWANVWAYTSIPSVEEILVVSSMEISAELLRRGTDGNWPDRPALLRDGEILLESIGYRGPLAAFYRTTKFARA
jgi:Uma2 family endonuclease